MKNNIQKIEVSTLLALCDILDSYEAFRNRLSLLLNNKNINPYKLIDLADGTVIIGHLKVKKFYNDNKDIIDKLRQHSCICEFINFTYLYNKKANKESEIEFFYKYFLNNIDKLEIIKSLLKRIKKLGINFIEFDAQADFTVDEYCINSILGDNYQISYLDNMKAISNYNSSVVKYITTNSNYLINVGVLSPSSIISNNRKSITVNSLFFDPDRLPKELSQESIFNNIIALKKECQEECIAIKNSVDLNILLDNLNKQIQSIYKVIESIEQSENKIELKKVLDKLLKSFEELQLLDFKYNEDIVQTYNSITSETLEEEKKLQLRRIYLNSIDID